MSTRENTRLIARASFIVGCEFSYFHDKTYADITQRDSNVTWIKSINFTRFVPLIRIAN